MIRVCAGGGGIREKQRNKGKSGKEDLTWLQRNWIYKSGHSGALLHSRSNETQALLTSSSNPRTVVAVVGTDRGLSPKAAGNRLHCKIIWGDNKVLRMRMRLRSFFKRFPARRTLTPSTPLPENSPLEEGRSKRVRWGCGVWHNFLHLGSKLPVIWGQGKLPDMRLTLGRHHGSNSPRLLDKGDCAPPFSRSRNVLLIWVFLHMVECGPGGPYGSSQCKDEREA